MKSDKNFRLSKTAKTILALLCKTTNDRSHLKSMLIQSEMAGAAARKASLKSKGKTKDGE